MKWIGAVVLVIGSYIIGTLVASEEEKRLKTVCSLILFLKYMKRKIRNERKTLNSIFLDFNDEYLESCGFLPSIRGNKNPKSAWKAASAKLNLDDSLMNEVALFGNDLGSLPLDDQLNRIDSLTMLLNEEAERLKSSLPNRKKCIKTVGLLVGMLAAIIMI